MSQHDFNIANQGFPAFRADLNSGLEALATNSSGSTEPTTTFAYQFWYDEANDLLKMRNSDNDAWITLASFDQATDEWELRSAVVQAVDAAGLSIKTDDGTTRFSVDDSGQVSFENYSFPTADGTSGQALVTDGSGNLSFDDVATDITSSDLPAGSVIQVVQSVYATEVSTSSTSYVDTDLAASITPFSTNNKILVTVNQQFLVQEAPGDLVRGSIRLVRDSSVIYGGVNKFEISYTAEGSSKLRVHAKHSLVYLDSPATASSVTYKTEMAVNDSGYIMQANHNNIESTITLMEIAG